MTITTRIKAARGGEFRPIFRFGYPETAKRRQNFEPTCPFGHGISKPLTEFEQYLKTQNKRNIRQIVSYASRYLDVLHTGDASPILAIKSPTTRHHTMEALTAYSKYADCYDRWQEIRKSYNLKWTNGDESLASLQRFFDTNLTLESMLQRVRNMMRVLPLRIRNVIEFACLTGLRPSEACESVRLLTLSSIEEKVSSKDERLNYYNPEQQTLEHFRFPDIFVRPTKKAYISYLSTDNYQRIASLGRKSPHLGSDKISM